MAHRRTNVAIRRRPVLAAAPMRTGASRATSSARRSAVRSCTSGFRDRLPPGHYRVALAVNPAPGAARSIRTPPRGTAGGRPWSAVAAIQNPPRIPGDRRWLVRTTRSRPALCLPGRLTSSLNINCRKCTLQVVQFMAEHAFNNPGGYSLSPLRAAADHSGLCEAARPDGRLIVNPISSIGGRRGDRLPPADAGAGMTHVRSQVRRV